MTVFVDTSGLYAVLDRNESRHAEASQAFTGLLDRSASLVTHNYVLVEVMALVARRLGVMAVRVLTQELLAPVRIEWIDQRLHAAALSALLASEGRRPSFVDRVSFGLMRQRGVEDAFAIDRDFDAQGFRTLPS